MAGFFIVFEGPDGSGKTTQARLLAEYLANKMRPKRQVILVEEPGGTSTGDEIRKILLDRKHSIEPLAELFLYEASRSQLVREIIKPALAVGKIIIADRYSMSSLAYQGYGRGIDLKFIEELNWAATEGLEPDLVFVLDLSPQEGLKRKGKKDRIEREALDFYRRVREGYLQLANRDKGTILLDGMKSPEEVFQEILSVVEKFIKLDL